MAQILAFLLEGRVSGRLIAIVERAQWIFSLESGVFQYVLGNVEGLLPIMANIPKNNQFNRIKAWQLANNSHS